jgi:hypothetical protein
VDVSVSWAPTLEQVAVHIPTRTREVGALETNDYTGTFTANTTPTSTHVQSLIDQTCAYISAQVGTPVLAAAEDSCQVAAALWTAYWVELGFPERDADLKTYEQIKADAAAATKQARLLNLAAGGGQDLNPDPIDTAYPTHTFPAAPPWADITFW